MPRSRKRKSKSVSSRSRQRKSRSTSSRGRSRSRSTIVNFKPHIRQLFREMYQELKKTSYDLDPNYEISYPPPSNKEINELNKIINRLANRIAQRMTTSRNVIEAIDFFPQNLRK